MSPPTSAPGLAPPALQDDTASSSSSNLSPGRCVFSLGPRRRSASMLLADPPPNSPSPQPPACADAAPADAVPEPPSAPALSVSPITSTPTPPTLALIVTRMFDLLRMSAHHPATLLVSSPSTLSPRSSSDTLLPLSASPEQTSFSPDLFSEKERTRGRTWGRNTPSVHAPILFVLMLFPLSTAIVFFAMSTLPISVSWPRTLADLAQLGRELHGYSQSGPGPMAHVIGVMAVTAVWKHAWSIPGSVLWNVLAGALFTPVFATLLLTTLTTIGSLMATLLAVPLAPLFMQYFPRVLELTRNALEGGAEEKLNEKGTPTSAWVRLSILRLIGVVPWSGINIACGVCGVSWFDCILGTFIGTLPWTAVTCSVGDILQTVASTPSPTPQSISSLIASPEIVAKLVFLSFLSLAPILGRDRLRSLISGREREESAEERASRWHWVHEWREKIRLPSRSPTAESERLEVLIQEKMRDEQP